MYIYNDRPRYASGEPALRADWVKVFVPRLGVWHHGIVARVYPLSAAGGFAVDVAHNMKATGVALTRGNAFAEGNVIVLVRHASSPAHASEILARVKMSMGKPYNLFAQNCEHFASFAFTGKAESKSLQVISGIAAVGVVGALLLRG